MTSASEVSEQDLEKKLLSICNALPAHLNLWKKVLQEVRSPLNALGNFARQLQYVEAANVKYIDGFNRVQEDLQAVILNGIEEELEAINHHIDKLNKSNHDLENKLAALEKATIHLNWDLDWPVIKGGPYQPPLDKILRMAYDFWVFFAERSKKVNRTLKALNVRDQKSVEEFQKSFTVNLGLEECSPVHSILQLTQYLISKN